MVELIERSRARLETLPVMPGVQGGAFRKYNEKDIPAGGCELQAILQSVEERLVPMLTQWQSERFFAYFPSLISHVSTLADMFAQTFHSPSFTFKASPAHAEV